MPNAALSLTDVSVSLAGQDTLRNLSFALQPGECVAVFGGLGAGKSALLRAAAGQLRPTSGLLQRAAQTVLITGDAATGWRKAGRYAGTDALETDGLLDLAGRRLSTLSRAERQGVELARAMAGAPGLVLLDDPAPDVVARARGSQAAVLFATRHPTLALDADRVLVLDGGALLRDGAATDVYDKPGTMRVARLFGPANALSGTAGEARPDGYYWSTAGLRHFQAAAPDAVRPAPGGPVLLCLRPERLYPVAPDAIGENVLDAQVVGLRRDGPWLLADLATPMGAMKARLDLAWAGLQPRHALRVAWDAAAPAPVAASGTSVA